MDVLVSEEENNLMTAPRIHSRHTHGTGCTLASAVAANLALGNPLEAAVNMARDYVFEAIRSAPKLGRGNGPLNHGLALPDREEDKVKSDNPFAVLKGLKD